MPSGDEPKTPKARRSASASSTSRSLLARLRHNDADAWARLVSLYTPLVYLWCQRRNVTEQDIPDVVQEVFKSVTTSITKIRKDRPQDTFRGWLRPITRSKAVDHFRRQTRRPIATGGSAAQRRMKECAAEVEDDETVEEPVYNAIFLRALELIRKEFQEHTWQAFWRVAVDGRPAKDVGEELSMRPGTVRVAKSRVLQRLRQELGELLE